MGSMYDYRDANGRPLAVGARVRLPNWTEEEVAQRKDPVPYAAGLGTILRIEDPDLDSPASLRVQFDMEDDGTTPGVTEQFSFYTRQQDGPMICDEIEVID